MAEQITDPGFSSLCAGMLNSPITEEEVIGALLHDAAEDWGGRPRLHDIEKTFGSTGARHVAG